MECLMTQTDKRDLRERVYTNDTARRLGLRVWPQIFRELQESRGLVWILARRNITARYRQSVLGYLWVIIPPLLAVLVFSWLIQYRVVNIGPAPLPYLSYALLNISIWFLFSNLVIAATRSLVEAGTLVTRVNFPKITLVFASTADAILEFIIRLVAVAIVFSVQGVEVGWGSLIAPVLLIPLILLALGLGMFLSILNLVVRDTASVVGIALTVGMYLTPVLYPPPKLEPFVFLNLFNPVSPILENIRALLVDGTLVSGGLLMTFSVLSLLLFMAGWRVFILAMPRINERA